MKNLITALHIANLESYIHYTFSPTFKGLLHDMVTI